MPSDLVGPRSVTIVRDARHLAPTWWWADHVGWAAGASDRTANWEWTMDPDVYAPLIVTLVLILTVGGVALLRPISKRLGDIAELMLRDKQGDSEKELRRVGDLLETMSARLALLEDRQDFTERLLSAPTHGKESTGSPEVSQPEAGAHEAP